MAVIGCYTLDLYCDGSGADVYGTSCPNFVPGLSAVHEFTGPTLSDCIRQARKRGWKFNRDKTKAHCPHCAKHGPSLTSI